jgi:predicted nucleic acid-binding protein
MLAVTNTPPLHYLILIGQVDLLSHLYTHVIIPQAVVGELLHPHTPPDVRAWIRALPPWCEIRQSQQAIPKSDHMRLAQ